MTDVTKPMDIDAWLRRLNQDFELGQSASQALREFLNLEVTTLKATLTPSQVYDRKILTFRGTYEVTLIRNCVVSLDDFEETVSGKFERSFALSPTAPAVPETAEEADEFPFEGVALLDMLGDELALNISPFPRKPGATLPDHSNNEKEYYEAQSNPFAVLQSLKTK